MKIFTVRFLVLPAIIAALMLVGASRIDAQEDLAEGEPAEAEPVEESEKVVTRHLLDVGLDQLGRDDQNLTSVSLGYTWAPGEYHSVNITTSFVDPEGLGPVEENEGFLLSDTAINYSWTGNTKVEARPWLPNRFGSGLGLVVPTGSPEKGAGGDMWIVTPYLGLVKTAGKKLVVLPTLSYMQSFAEGDLAVPIQAIAAEIGLLYALSPRWWIFYRPTIMREFELSETVLLNLLQVGREVGKRHGVSLEYGSVSDEVFSQAIGFRSNVNYRVTLRAHFGFR